MNALPAIPLGRLAIAFLPVAVLIAVLYRWRVRPGKAAYANVRMLVQLLAVGYVLDYLLDTTRPLVVLGVLAIMLLAAAWIGLDPLARRSLRRYLAALAALGLAGGAMLALVTQVVLSLSAWYDPRFVIPLGSMILSNAMNTVSLAAERFDAERARDVTGPAARRTALDAALIPQVNTLLAVGIVALPGMMTGQILSGVDPLLAVRYQIMVMCMVFGSAGLAAACYLRLLEPIRRGAGPDRSPDRESEGAGTPS